HLLSVVPCVRGDCCPASPGGPVAMSEECCALLEHVRQSNRSYESLDTYDLTGRRIHHHERDGKHPMDRLPEDFFSILAASKDLTLAPKHPTAAGSTGILIGHPIVNSSGAVGAYLAATVDLSGALEPVFQERAGLGRSGRVYFVSPEGRYFFPPPDADRTGWTGTRLDLPAEILSGKTDDVFEYVGAGGEKVLGVSTLIPEVRWVLVAEINKSEAYAWLGRLRTRAMVTGAVTLGLVLAIAVKGSRRLSRPLREMAAVSRRIAEGRHEERLGVLEGTEAEEVGRAFNKMLDQLAASHRRLMHAASLAAVGELSSSIVHEMRNPLSSVKINLQALCRRVEADPAYAELGAIALAQLARVERMLSDLLGYGKPLELMLTRTTFGKIAKDVVEVVRSEAEEKRVTITVENHLDPIQIVADEEQIHRALTNLVTNAIQAVAPGGAVKVWAALAPGDRTKAMVRVSDNGPGIPEARRDELFKPFFTTKAGGTGLGLANVKKIVEAHAGSCFAENPKTGGAVFTLLLPVGGPPV
ncbi:MAG: sensor histidine kinase, partial [Candidatus Sumerlaeia bacterium]|nr:sensor histidine kinase [Candidatus Sumerlaeia bacterium]